MSKLLKQNTSLSSGMNLLVACCFLALTSGCSLEDLSHAKSAGSIAASNRKSDATTDYPFALSAGTATSIVNPAAMQFGVEYRLRQDSSHNLSLKHLWIIDRASGPTVEVERDLSSNGKLEAAVFDWKVEQQPFVSYLVALAEDGARIVVSNTVEMRVQ